MDAELLARLQFTLTISYHFIFPPLSMGLGLMLLFVSGMYLRTKDPKWRQLQFFWVKIYGIIFAMGVATGVVMEFEFGMNWSEYSRFVGNIFGSLLAAEGVFAFFLEGGFLGLMLFGGNRLGPRMWFLASLMVVFGAHFSALWIVMANSWMQTPAGYDIQTAAGAGPRGHDRLLGGRLHALVHAAHHARLLRQLDRRRGPHGQRGRLVHPAQAASSPSWASSASASRSRCSSSSPSPTASSSVPSRPRAWPRTSPPSWPPWKACGRPRRTPRPTLFGWVDEGSGETVGLAVPGLLSFLSGQDTVTGINDFEVPPTVVNLTFQSYHLMVGLGMAIIPFALLAAGLWFWKRKLLEHRWALWIVVSSVFVSLFVITMGWWVAELGRQPWIVYELMFTADATSPVVAAWEIVASLGMFILIYTLLLVVFMYLLNNKIQHGPAPLEEVEAKPVDALPDTLRGIFAARGSGEERMTR